MGGKVGFVSVIGVLAAFWAFGSGAADGAVVRPFETEGRGVENEIDRLVRASSAKAEIKPANRCSDAVFLRRVYLDITGKIPEPAAVREFLNDKGAGKRSAMIDKLLASDAAADYQAMKWCDILRVKAEFPINLWPNAVQAYHRWILDAAAENMPYDRFARELLTSSGSNFRTPPVNFYRAIQGQESSAIARAVALTFMGARFDEWPAGRREGMEAFFARIKYKPTAEWKEEIVGLDPAPQETLKAVFPEGKTILIKPGQDPRIVFADWLITAENPWFVKSIVNRVWSWFLGRGLIHEPDDIRPNNPAVHPEVLAYLEKELVEAKWDLRHIYRLILNSQTYQQSAIPQSDNPKAEAMFACYPVRRLEAEVLIDALCQISGTRESYSSAIPEPFTFIPEHHMSVELADGSISSQFLEMFGRPSRDTGLESERSNEPTDAQRLHLLNSTHVQRKIEQSGRFRYLLRNAKGNWRMVVNQIYLNVLSRYPTEAEAQMSLRYFGVVKPPQPAVKAPVRAAAKGRGRNQPRRKSQTPAKKAPAAKKVNTTQAAHDLLWALINTKEFLYRH